jgi:hypothetical protein
MPQAGKNKRMALQKEHILAAISAMCSKEM